jgi:hypothetical protein
MAKRDAHDIGHLVIPCAPASRRGVLQFAYHVGGTVKLHAMSLVRGHKKLLTVHPMTWVENHGCLLGDALRRLLAFEMLLQEMPNQPCRARAPFAFGVELGLERFGKLDVESLHLHDDPPSYW